MVRVGMGIADLRYRGELQIGKLVFLLSITLTLGRLNS